MRRAELHLGQRARRRVALAPRRGEVEDVLAGLDGGGPEALVDGQLAARALRGAAGDGERVALHDEVELARLAPEQRVAHGAADDPDARLAGHRAQGGRVAQALEDPRGHAGTLEAHGPA